MKANGRSVWQDSKTGKWKYQVRVVQLGSKPKVVQRTASSKQEAAQLADELYLALKSASVQANPRMFGDLVANYLIIKASYITGSTLANNKYLLDKYVLPEFGGKLVDSITPAAAQAFLIGLQGRLATGSVNKIQSVMSSVFSLSLRNRQISYNPIALVPSLRPLSNESSQVQDPWSVAEAQSALKAVENTIVDFFVHATLSLGLRRGEAMGLRWGDLDFDRGIIEIRNNRGSRRQLSEENRVVTRTVEGDLKTVASRRRLAMTNLVLLSLLRERQRLEKLGVEITPQTYVCLSARGIPIGESTLYRTFNKILKANSIRRIRIHDIRHTAAVCALEAEIALEKVTYGLGHTSTEVTKKIYAARVPALSVAFSRALADVLDPSIATQGVKNGGWVNV